MPGRPTAGFFRFSDLPEKENERHGRQRRRKQMSNVNVLFLNASLKASDQDSNTTVLMEEVAEIMEKEGASVEELRLADYNIKFGMAPDMGGGDEWPEVFEKVKAADVLIVGTPLWIGEKSSVANLAMERLYASSSETKENGQAIYYNKVGGTVITGNEDGAKHAAASILYGLSHIGFVVPPNVDAYWVGEAGPGRPIWKRTGTMTLPNPM